MEIRKETKYTIELTKQDAQNFIKEMNIIYPLFASENDVDEIKTLLQLKDELVMSFSDD